MGDGGFQFLDILLLGAIAGFIALRLRAVLGQRTGHEQRRRRPPFAGPSQESEADKGSERDNVVALPRREAEKAAPEDAITARLRAVDPSFDRTEFLAGAKAAYEMIVTSFAAGDKDALRPLLSREVFADFASAIDERAKRDETMETTFVGMRAADIIDAQVNGRIAEITVKFESELISVTKDANGHVVAGHANAVEQVTDIWTFARDTSSRDPNWTLIATSAPQ
ncbi:Tim44/TimA family putative adaptor protein [uncultured Ferrovibrio sp.]|jgi:predicted lipid-binding transport protein (Tim44 family)|uniref:Tim44/TimA family putative adaptor protein n=1 Tax=uncultured Ferrovibrio sp. TaxID=1576913 RepID=UPI00262A749D|nr:Tim44/TimA family putative adaptor protein [uncultured Ferrovibrio sp.]